MREVEKTENYMILEVNCCDENEHRWGVLERSGDGGYLGWAKSEEQAFRIAQGLELLMKESA